MDLPMSRKEKNKPTVRESALPSNETRSAMELLKSLKLLSGSKPLLDINARSSTRMVYTNGLTIWFLILQRLFGGKSLDEIVSYVLAHEPDLLPENKRVREGRLSENTAAYSRARKRLPVEAILSASEAICNRLGEMSPKIFGDRRVFIIDGTTITLPPTQALRDKFPPASNQHGESVWPVAMLMVANEMASGCALLPQIDAMYGENNASEAVQAERILTKLPENAVILADSGFGIYSVAHHSVEAKHDFLFRLTGVRYKPMREKAKLIDHGRGWKTYRLRWKPSKSDRRSTPSLPQDASIEVELHEVDIGAKTPLYLVSNLRADAKTAADLYRRRYDIEFDIRDLKVTMDAENIRAKSVDMVMKELYTSVVAYNLVAQFRRLSAEKAGVKPRQLSFNRVWTRFKDRLLFQSPKNVQEWRKLFEKAISLAGKTKLPERPKPRSSPREAHPRRQKSTKFQKNQRRQKAEEPTPKALK
jgi:hypothetical protein